MVKKSQKLMDVLIYVHMYLAQNIQQLICDFYFYI